MTDNIDNVKTLYQNLKTDGYDMGNEEDFQKALCDKDQAKTLFDNLTADGYEMGDFDSFYSSVNTTPAPGGEALGTVTQSVKKPGEDHEGTVIGAPEDHLTLDKEGNVVPAPGYETNIWDKMKRKAKDYLSGDNKSTFGAKNTTEEEKIAKQVQTKERKQPKIANRDILTDEEYNEHLYGKQPEPFPSRATSTNQTRTDWDQASELAKLGAARTRDISFANQAEEERKAQPFYTQQEFLDWQSKPENANATEEDYLAWIKKNRPSYMTRGMKEEQAATDFVNSTTVVDEVTKSIQEALAVRQAEMDKIGKEHLTDDPRTLSNISTVANDMAKTNKNIEPDKIIEKVKDRMNMRDFTLAFFDKLQKNADELGMGITEYTDLVKPKLEEAIGNNVRAQLATALGPQTDLGYIVQGISNSILGMITDKLIYSNDQIALKQQGTQEYSAKREKEAENGGLLKKVGYYAMEGGNVASGFVADGWMMAGGGKLSLGAVEQIGKSFIKDAVAKGISEQEARLIMQQAIENSPWSTKIKTKLLQSVVGGSINLGTYNMATETARQFQSGDWDMGRIINETLKGMVTGGAVGVGGTLTGSATEKATQLARRGAEKLGTKAMSYGGSTVMRYAPDVTYDFSRGIQITGNVVNPAISFAVENGIFTGIQEAEKYYNGEGKNIDLVKDLEKGAIQLLAMKATGKVKQVFTQPKQTLADIKKVWTGDGPLRLTDEERQELTQSKDWEDLGYALLGRTASNPAFQNNHLRRDLEVQRAKDKGETPRELTPEEQAQGAYNATKRLLASDKLSWSTKQKVAMMLRLGMSATKPQAYGYRTTADDHTGTYTAETTDKDGHVIDRLHFKTEAEMNDWAEQNKMYFDAMTDQLNEYKAKQEKEQPWLTELEGDRPVNSNPDEPQGPEGPQGPGAGGAGTTGGTPGAETGGNGAEATGTEPGVTPGEPNTATPQNSFEPGQTVNLTIAGQDSTIKIIENNGDGTYQVEDAEGTISWNMNASDLQAWSGEYNRTHQGATTTTTEPADTLPETEPTATESETTSTEPQAEQGLGNPASPTETTEPATTATTIPATTPTTTPAPVQTTGGSPEVVTAQQQRQARVEQNRQKGQQILQTTSNAEAYDWMMQHRVALNRLNGAFKDGSQNAQLKNQIQELAENGQPEQALQMLDENTSQFSELQKRALEDYIDTFTQQDAFDKAQAQQTEQMIADREAELKKVVSETGEIIPIELTNGQDGTIKAFLLNGDLNNGLGTVRVAIPDGKGGYITPQIPTRRIVKKDGGYQGTSLEQMMQQERARIVQEQETKWRNKLNGTTFEPGDVVTLGFEGESARWTVLGRNQAGEIVFQPEGSADPGERMALTPQEASQWVAEGRNITIQNTIKADNQARIEAQRAEAQRQQEQAEAEKQQRYAQGVVGYQEGHPDYTHENTDATIAGEMIREAQPDTAQRDKIIKRTQEGLQQQIDQMQKQKADAQANLNAFGGDDVRKDALWHEEIQEADAKIADAQRRIAKWNDIREAALTEKEKKGERNQRQKEVNEAQLTAEGALNQKPMSQQETDIVRGKLDKASKSGGEAPGTVTKDADIVRMPKKEANEWLLQNNQTMMEADSYLEEQRLIRKAEIENIDEQISRKEWALKNHVEGTERMTPEEIKRTADDIAMLKQVRRAVIEEAGRLNELKKSLESTYKERNEMNLAGMTPAEQRQAEIANARDHDSKMKKAKKIYGDLIDENAMVPMTAEEYVAQNLPMGQLNWEGLERGEHHVRGFQEAIGRNKRRGVGRGYDTNSYNAYLAPKGEGIGIDEMAHQLWENQEGEKLYDSQEIANAIMSLLTGAEKPSDIRDYVLNNRIEQAERTLQAEEEHAREAEELMDDYFPPVEGTGVDDAEMPFSLQETGTNASGTDSETPAQRRRLTPQERELGNAMADQLAEMGIKVHTDLESYQKGLKEAKADKSQAGKTKFFVTPDGRRYGYERKGEIYLDPRMLNAEAPIHEYGHLWGEALRKMNPEEWQNVVSILKSDPDTWKFVTDRYPHLTDENDIAEEVLSQFGGKHGAEKMRQVQAEMEARGIDEATRSKYNNILAKISKACQDFWKSVGNFFSMHYESTDQIYDQMLKDFANGVNPRKFVDEQIKAKDAEYERAVKDGDEVKTKQLFEEALEENIGNGIIPFIGVGGYRTNGLQKLAHEVKTRDPKVIERAATLMAPFIPENAVLVPAPSHTGRATDMLDLAQAISEKTGAPVADVLVGNERESNYGHKKATGQSLTEEELGIRQEGELPEGKIPVVIDNVVGTGTTASASVKALGKGVVVCLGTAAKRNSHAVGLKSAEPVVTDKNGKLVPLSKRFDLGVKDLGKTVRLGEPGAQENIKYSVPEETGANTPGTGRTRANAQGTEQKPGVPDKEWRYSGLSDKELETIDRISKDLGMNVVFEDRQPGSSENGWIDTDGRTIHLVRGSRGSVDFVMGHEVTHQLKADSRRAYKTFEESAHETIKEIEGEENYEAWMQKRLRQYRKHAYETAKAKALKNGMTEEEADQAGRKAMSKIKREQILEEGAADIAGEMRRMPEVADKMLHEIAKKEQPEKMRGLSAKMVNLITKVKHALRMDTTLPAEERQQEETGLDALASKWRQAYEESKNLHKKPAQETGENVKSSLEEDEYKERRLRRSMVAPELMNEQRMDELMDEMTSKEDEIMRLEDENNALDQEYEEIDNKIYPEDDDETLEYDELTELEDRQQAIMNRQREIESQTEQLNTELTDLEAEYDGLRQMKKNGYGITPEIADQYRKNLDSDAEDITSRMSELSNMGGQETEEYKNLRKVMENITDEYDVLNRLMSGTEEPADALPETEQEAKGTEPEGEASGTEPVERTIYSDEKAYADEMRQKQGMRFATLVVKTKDGNYRIYGDDIDKNKDIHGWEDHTDEATPYLEVKPNMAPFATMVKGGQKIAILEVPDDWEPKKPKTEPKVEASGTETAGAEAPGTEPAKAEDFFKKHVEAESEMDAYKQRKARRAQSYIPGMLDETHMSELTKNIYAVEDEIAEYEKSYEELSGETSDLEVELYDNKEAHYQEEWDNLDAMNKALDMYQAEIERLETKLQDLNEQRDELERGRKDRKDETTEADFDAYRRDLLNDITQVNKRMSELSFEGMQSGEEYLKLRDVMEELVDESEALDRMEKGEEPEQTESEEETPETTTTEAEAPGAEPTTGGDLFGYKRKTPQMREGDLFSAQDFEDAEKLNEIRMREPEAWERLKAQLTPKQWEWYVKTLRQGASEAHRLGFEAYERNGNVNAESALEANGSYSVHPENYEELSEQEKDDIFADLNNPNSIRREWVRQVAQTPMEFRGTTDPATAYGKMVDMELMGDWINEKLETPGLNDTDRKFLEEKKDAVEYAKNYYQKVYDTYGQTEYDPDVKFQVDEQYATLDDKGKDEYIDDIYKGKEPLSDEERKNVKDFLASYEIAPNLATTIFKITPVEKSEFDLNQDIVKLKKQVKTWAKGHGITRTISPEESRGKGEIRISLQSIGKMADKSAWKKSVSKEAHFACIANLRDIIINSEEAESYNNITGKDNDNQRDPRYGVSSDLKMHRLYGAIRYEGEEYRVKTTLKEIVGNTDEPMKAYSYEVQTIELLSPHHHTPGEDSSDTTLDSSSIDGANLLNNVEKSYQPGKLILDGSKDLTSVKLSLPEEQIHSDNFKNWFGDWEKDPEKASKMVDDTGKPKVFYHGTPWNPMAEPAGKAVFDERMRGTGSGDNGFFGEGHYFAFTEPEARTYGRNVVPVYLDIKNPFYFLETFRDFNGKEYDGLGEASESIQMLNLAKKFPELAKSLDITVRDDQTGDERTITPEEYARKFEDVYKNKEFIIQENVDYQNKDVIQVCADPVVKRADNGATWTEYNFKIAMLKPRAGEDAQAEYTHLYLTDNRQRGLQLWDGETLVSGEIGHDVYSLPNTHYVFESKEFTDAIKKRGYDGIVQSKTGDEAVVFKANQIKSATDNNGDFSTTNDDIRYSLPEEGKKEDEKSMLGLHNLSADNLRHVLKMGGIANPSTAVIDMNKGNLENFGEISLLMTTDLIAKKTGKNAGTWSADAYSPRYPYNSVVYKAGERSAKKLEKALNKGTSVGTISQVIGYINDKGLEGLRRSTVTKVAFVSEMGNDPTVLSKSKYAPEVTDIVKKNAYTTLNGEKYVESSAWTDEQWNALADAYKKYFMATHDNSEEAWERTKQMHMRWFTTPETAPDWRKESDAEHRAQIEKYGADIRELERFVMDVLRDAELEGKPDRYATEDEANRYVSSHQKEYDKWTQDLYDKLGIDEKLFQGFDYSGTRIYKPHTLENVSKMMKKQSTAGGESMFLTSPGALRAKVTPIYSTIEQIRKNKGRIVKGEEFEKIRNQISDEFFNLEQLVEGDMSGDEGFYRLEEAMKYGADWLNRNYDDIDLDEEDIQRINDFRTLLKTAPTEYFETKFERPVKLNEFAAAVVPENLPKDLVDALEENGLKVAKYNPSVPGDRAKVQRELAQQNNLMFSLDENEPLYSPAGYAVENSKQEKAKPEQWLKMIEKAGGLKKEEDKWMGLSDWLNSQGNKTLTKQDVLDYIAQNKVQIEEVNYGQTGEIPNYIGLLIRQGFTPEEAIENANLRVGEFSQEPYWTEKEVSNYKPEDFTEDGRYIGKTPIHIINGTRERYQTEGLENNKEIALTVPAVEPYHGSMPAVHFDDNYTKGKTVAWIRFGDAKETSDYQKAVDEYETFRKKLESKGTTAIGSLSPEEKAEFTRLQDNIRNANKFGGRVLVIDEVQSQRHQDAREKGYKPTEKELREAEVRRKKAWQARFDMAQKLSDKSKYGSDILSHLRDYDLQMITKDELAKYITPEEAEEYAKISEEFNNSYRTYAGIEFDDRNNVPDAPFRKNWQELAMKRMLRYAAEHGYDKIAWTTGQQQAGRYDLGKVISGVELLSSNDKQRTYDLITTEGGHYRMKVDSEGNVIESGISGINEGTPLENAVGKDLAEKMSKLDTDDENEGILEVDKLPVGGEGMKGFYDKMLVNFMDKYGKKWGVKTKDITLDLPNEEDRVMHSVDITPEMKESVMKGQPMFSLDENEPLYSPAGYAVENSKQEKAKPEQWLKMITKAGGLKQEEDKWIGLSDWLKSQGNKTLTKQDVLDYIAQNKVQIEEVNYSEDGKELRAPMWEMSPDKVKEAVQYSDAFDYLRDQLTNYDENEQPYFDEDAFSEIWAKLKHTDERKADDFYNAFSPDYWHETVDIDNPYLAARYLDLDIAKEPEGDVEHQINGTRERYQTEGLENNKEIALTVPTVEPYHGNLPEVHFDDKYTGGKTIAWARFGDAKTGNSEYNEAVKAYDDFTDAMLEKYDVNTTNMTELADNYLNEAEKAEMNHLYQAMKDAEKNGNTDQQKVLVIDEVQSQRHQDAREVIGTDENDKPIRRGYKTGKVDLGRMQKAYDEAEKELLEYTGSMARKYNCDYEEAMYHMNNEEQQIFIKLYNAEEKASKALSEATKESNAVPDAPFQKNWHELVMKRMLRYAAEHGYDKIAWTTGQQQADRYANILSTVVDDISYGPWAEGSDNYEFSDFDSFGEPARRIDLDLLYGGSIQLFINRDGKIISSVNNTEYEGKMLKDLIGTELSKKIVGDNNEGKIHTEALRIIGSEGMKGFYDKMLVNFMDKYGKKWGVKTKDITLDLPNEEDRVMHSVDITPEMKESVMKGQPMFSLEEETGGKTPGTVAKEEGEWEKWKKTPLFSTRESVISPGKDVVIPKKAISLQEPFTQTFIRDFNRLANQTEGEKNPLKKMMLQHQKAQMMADYAQRAGYSRNEAYASLWSGILDSITSKDVPSALTLGRLAMHRGKIRGVTVGWNGKTYEVAKNIPDVIKAVETLAHEATHQDYISGDTQYVNAVLNMMDNGEITRQDLIDAIRKAKGGKTYENFSDRLLADEFIARGVGRMAAGSPFKTTDKLNAIIEEAYANRENKRAQNRDARRAVNNTTDDRLGGGNPGEAAGRTSGLGSGYTAQQVDGRNGVRYALDETEADAPGTEQDSTPGGDDGSGTQIQPGDDMETVIEKAESRRSMQNQQRDRSRKPRRMKNESQAHYMARLRDWRRAEERLANATPQPQHETFAQQAQAEYQNDMEAWKQRHGLNNDQETGNGWWMRREGESDEQWLNRLKQNEAWNRAMEDTEDPMPNSFDYDMRAQQRYREAYEQWKIANELTDEANMDLQLYEGRGGNAPEPTEDREDGLENQQIQREMAESVGYDVTADGARRHMKNAVIERRKQLESSSAEDALWIEGLRKKIDDASKALGNGHDLNKELPGLIELPNYASHAITDAYNEANDAHFEAGTIETLLPYILGDASTENLSDESKKKIVSFFRDFLESQGERAEEAGLATIDTEGMREQWELRKRPEVQALMTEIKDWYDDFYHHIDDAGLRRDAGYVLNYVNHVWDKAKSTKEVWDNYQRMTSPNMRHREVFTYEEGIQIGLAPKYENITDMLAHYSRQNNEALANRALLDYVSNISISERNADGEVTRILPIVSDVEPREFDKDRYVRYKVPGVGDVWVLSEAQEYFASVFGTERTQDVKPWVSQTGHVYDLTASTMKKIQLGLSGFHALALSEVALAQMNPIAGAKALLKYVCYDALKKGTIPAYAHPEDFKLAAGHLVSLGATQDYCASDVNALTGQLRELCQELYDKNKAVGAVPLTVSTMMDWMNRGIDKVLWNYIHDGLKIACFKMYADDIYKKARKNGWDQAKIDKMLDEAGQLTNDTFGGQYWEILGISPSTIKWMRRAFLSPDWLISTQRHFASMTGFGSLYSEEGFLDYVKHTGKRLFGKDELDNDGRKFRQKESAFCYLVGVIGMYFPMMNVLNAYFRHKDEEEEKAKAEEERKHNPNYQSPYELKYPDGMKWYDYTMLGNTVGQQTHLFTGRYDDGTETYVRWGKQFREFPELFMGRHGVEFPTPLMERMLGKANPVFNYLVDACGYLGMYDFHTSYDQKELQEKYGKTIGFLAMTAQHFLPFSVPTQDDKEFKLMDLFMPSQKGFSKYKALDYFKTYVQAGDMNGVLKTYDACVMNNIDPKATLEAAIKSVQATQADQLKDGITDVDTAMLKFDEKGLSVSDKKKIKSALVKQLAGEEYEQFTKAQAEMMFNDYLNPSVGDEDTSDKELKLQTSTDVLYEYKVKRLRALVKRQTDKYDKMMNSGQSEEAAAFRKSHAKYFTAQGMLNELTQELKSYRSTLGHGNDKKVILNIRKARKRVLDSIGELQ